MFSFSQSFFEIAELNPGAAEEAYFSLLNGSERTDEVALKVKEEAVYRLAKLHVVGRQFDKVLGLLQNANPLFAQIPKVHIPNSLHINLYFIFLLKKTPLTQGKDS